MKLGLVSIVTACGLLSGCVNPDPSAHMRATANGQCCVGPAVDDRITVLGETSPQQSPGCYVEVVASDSLLRRDAFSRASVIGRVARGEAVARLDFIDRRLRVLGRTVFDGGYWLKIRDPRGSEGWLPAAETREIQEPCANHAFHRERPAQSARGWTMIAAAL